MSGEQNVSSRPHVCPRCKQEVLDDVKQWTSSHSGSVWHFDCFAAAHGPHEGERTWTLNWQEPSGDTGLNR